MNKKILIADDYFVVMTGIKMILKKYLKNIDLEYALNYDEIFEKLADKTDYALLILDPGLQGNQKKMTAEIKCKFPNLKILIFSTHNTAEVISFILEGADGYLNKLSHEDEIARAVLEVLNTGKYYSKETMDALIHHSVSGKSNPLETLSEREKTVYKLLIKGYGNLEIANELKIHVATISTYKRRIFQKLGTNNLIDILEINRKYSME
ncbi:response regulator transcription factor [Chryseobacterium takakiae]|jgi:DNA-binding NarL/FixJ family response regulator|uniref:DNA-binding response regulator, NarL/FixJ family, contains REC and HTH domains n=1 Tax=Chryseobacterium takakiae TaxID=1302685 RepID=A0A1M4UZP2_9FLAO|nr:response regulator transcription factor [Chryseobacterium takakiae]SHE62145.1 DNA-binding response regulator, NarL/FixJ family, contains REC and HTH domains [Chryseobacterium takakiae]